MSPPRARIVDVHVPARPAGVVLVLHGGAARRARMMVSPAQLSVLRMIPVARRIVRACPGLAVFRLLNSSRGWDTTHTPVDDAAWALDRVRERLGELPVGLVGHSLGGRAALLTAGRAAVSSVVALAPWVYPTDTPDGAVAGVSFLFVHGSGDRIAAPDRSLAVSRTIARTAPVGYAAVEGGKHAMLRHGRVFEQLAAAFVATTLAGAPPTAALRAVLDGPLPTPVRPGAR